MALCSMSRSNTADLIKKWCGSTITFGGNDLSVCCAVIYIMTRLLTSTMRLRSDKFHNSFNLLTALVVRRRPYYTSLFVSPLGSVSIKFDSDNNDKNCEDFII